MDRWLDPLPLCHGNSPQIIFNNMRRDSLTGSPAALASRGLSGPSGAPPALSSAGCARCPPAAQGSEQGTASACFVESGGGSGREGTEGPQGTNWGLPKPPLALPDSAPQSEALVALLSSSTPAHRAVMPCNLPAARVVSAGSHRQPLHHLCARFSAKHCAHPLLHLQPTLPQRLPSSNLAGMATPWHSLRYPQSWAQGRRRESDGQPTCAFNLLPSQDEHPSPTPFLSMPRTGPHLPDSSWATFAFHKPKAGTLSRSFLSLPTASRTSSGLDSRHPAPAHCTQPLTGLPAAPRPLAVHSRCSKAHCPAPRLLLSSRPYKGTLQGHPRHSEQTPKTGPHLASLWFLLSHRLLPTPRASARPTGQLPPLPAQVRPLAAPPEAPTGSLTDLKLWFTGLLVRKITLVAASHPRSAPLTLNPRCPPQHTPQPLLAPPSALQGALVLFCSLMYPQGLEQHLLPSRHSTVIIK